MRRPASSRKSLSICWIIITFSMISIGKSLAAAAPCFIRPLLSRPSLMKGSGRRPLTQVSFAPLPPDNPEEIEQAAEQLTEFLSDKERVVALTGAGISTESGIPDYRGPMGSYSRGFKPMVHDQFINKPLQRSRYWARSMVGYKRFSRAKPNKGHQSLSRLEGRGSLDLICTFNVDGLHQAAGSQRVMDLHGRNDRVVCLGCGLKTSRRIVQQKLESLNKSWIEQYVVDRDQQQFADGDAEADGDFAEFVVPSCERCSGMLKPDVVFFGDVVPSQRVEEMYSRIEAADGVLVVGSSLMVYSGFRFILSAHKQGTPIAVLNHGPTRMEKEKIPHLKLEARAGDILSAAVDRLCKH